MVTFAVKNHFRLRNAFQLLHKRLLTDVNKYRCLTNDLSITLGAAHCYITHTREYPLGTDDRPSGILTQGSLIGGIDREKKSANASLAYVQCILSAKDAIAVDKERSSGEEELF